MKFLTVSLLFLFSFSQNKMRHNVSVSPDELAQIDSFYNQLILDKVDTIIVSKQVCFEGTTTGAICWKKNGKLNIYIAVVYDYPDSVRIHQDNNISDKNAKKLLSLYLKHENNLPDTLPKGKNEMSHDCRSNIFSNINGKKKHHSFFLSEMLSDCSSCQVFKEINYLFFHLIKFHQ